MAHRGLKFGIFLAPFHRVGENPTLAIARDVELLEWLDWLGYDEAWIGEHHSAGYEVIASPEVFIAAAADRTKHIRLGTGVSSLPYHHPFMLADRINQLDHMTRGRTMFGVGPGALVSDAMMMGIDPARQRDMMDEALGVIIRLLRGETVSHESDWFTLREARLQMTPYSRPHVEIAVASQVSPTGARAAGRHGAGLLSLGATSTGGFNALSSNWAIAEDMAREHGTVVDRAAWRLVGPMHIAETKDQAVADVRFGLEKWLYYFREIANLPVAPVEAGRDPVEALIETGLTVIGTPDEAADKIQALWNQSGGFGAFLFMAHNWAPWAATKRSYELFARYVAPRFQQLNDNRESSMAWVGAHKPEFTGQAVAAVGARIAAHVQEKGVDNISPQIAAMMGIKKPEAAE